MPSATNRPATLLLRGSRRLPPHGCRQKVLHWRPITVTDPRDAQSLSLDIGGQMSTSSISYWYSRGGNICRTRAIARRTTTAHLLRGSRRLPPPPHGCRQKVLHMCRIKWSVAYSPKCKRLPYNLMQMKHIWRLSTSVAGAPTGFFFRGS